MLLLKSVNNTLLIKIIASSIVLTLTFSFYTLFRGIIPVQVTEVYIDRYEEFTDNENGIKEERGSHFENDDSASEIATLNIVHPDVAGKSFIDAKENQRGSVNVYYYADICNDYDTKAVFWNTLFPRFPHKAKNMENFYDEQLITVGQQSRRMIGLVYPDKTDWYQFQINSRLGCEVRLIEDKELLQASTYDKLLLKLGLYKEQILREEDTKKPEKPFVVESEPVRLVENKVYMIDVIHVIPLYGFFRLKWKKKGDKTYGKIPPNLLSGLYKKPQVTDILPNITYPSIATENTRLKMNDRRNRFHEFATIQIKAAKSCEYRPSYIPDSFAPDTGVAFVQLDKLYPEHKLIEHHFNGGTYDLYIKKEIVFKVIRKFLQVLGSSYTLQHIVHIEQNNEGEKGKRYFVEIDVIKDGNTGKVYRSSGWIFIEDKSSEICTPNGYVWNEREMIYLLTPVKNQAKWIRYLVYSLNEIVEKTKEKHIHLMLYDFDSSDADVKSILQQAKFPYTYRQLHGKFSKVIGLNRAVSAIEAQDPIIFVFDLQLQLPLFLFDYIRKHTFRGRTTYVPICLRLNCGEHSEYTKLTRSSIWQEIGYGMISMFKSDWTKIGGMNESRFSDRWGGEDWELIDRVLKNKLEVIHHRLPGYYHIYHSTKGTWDGTKDY